MAQKTKSSNVIQQIALFLSIAALIVGVAGFVYLFMGAQSVDKHSNEADFKQDIIIHRLTKCVDENISPCPTLDDSKWSNGDYIGS